MVIILRGAMDGLSVVVPHGDSARAGLRGELVPEGLLDPPRVRSHFEAQDCLEAEPTIG